MPVWEYRENLQNYNRALLVNSNDVKRFADSFMGKSLKASWTPLRVEIASGSEKQSGDFFMLTGTAPVLNERARQILLPLIGNDVEFLPLECDTETLYVLNVIRVLNCLDHLESRFKYFLDGKIMDVTHYVFDEQCISQTHIFKIPEQLVRTYVSDTFKIFTETEKLNGLALKFLQ